MFCKMKRMASTSRAEQREIKEMTTTQHDVRIYGNTVELTRGNMDAAKLAAEVAAQLGTKLASSLRWYGPTTREVSTADGRTIRICES